MTPYKNIPWTEDDDKEYRKLHNLTKEKLSRIQASAQHECGCQLIQFKDKNLKFTPCSQHNTAGYDYQIAKLKRMLKP